MDKIIFAIEETGGCSRYIPVQNEDGIEIICLRTVSRSFHIATNLEKEEDINLYMDKFMYLIDYSEENQGFGFSLNLENGYYDVSITLDTDKEIILFDSVLVFDKQELLHLHQLNREQKWQFFRKALERGYEEKV
ncbi:MAG: hypothetical protein K2K06_10500 [Oscillospiraceae bacterium]|nr:hypothetical protein [Oscillospiraceae bacterium]